LSVKKEIEEQKQHLEEDVQAQTREFKRNKQVRKKSFIASTPPKL